MTEPILNHAHLVAQLREVKGPHPMVTCECGFRLPLRFSYKCLYCGCWFCQECAEIHFGKTKAEWERERDEKTG